MRIKRLLPPLAVAVFATLAFTGACGWAEQPQAGDQTGDQRISDQGITTSQAMADDLVKSGFDVVQVQASGGDLAKPVFTIRQAEGQLFYQEALLREALAARQDGASVDMVSYRVIDQSGQQIDYGGYQKSELDELMPLLGSNKFSRTEDDVHALLAERLAAPQYPAGTEVSWELRRYVGGCRMVQVDVKTSEADAELITEHAWLALNSVEELNAKDEAQIAVLIFKASDAAGSPLLWTYEDLELGARAAKWANDHLMPSWVHPPGNSPETGGT